MSRRRLQQASAVDGHNHPGATYIDAHVLLLTWRGASAQLSTEVAALQQCFSSKYNFETQVYSLSKPGSITPNIERFIRKKAHPANLLVVYYNDHSQMSQCDDMGHLISAYKTTPGCDLLFLWDCKQKVPCESSAWSSEATTQGTVWELLTSDILGPDQHVVSEDDASEGRSFTATLTEVLSDAAASDGPVSMENLRSRLVTMHRRARKDMPRVVLGSPTYDEGSVSGRSISLTRLPPRDEAQVTLCLRLKNDYDTTQWARWIDDIENESPTHQTSVTISVYRSAQLEPLTLVGVPISKWQWILDSPTPSASFVGFEIIGGTDAIAHPMSNIIEDHLASRLGTDNPYSTDSPVEPLTATTADPSPTRSKRDYSEFEGDAGGETQREQPKRARKALPTGRKLLPIERGVVLSPTSPSDDETVVVVEPQRKALPSTRTWSLPSITSPLSPSSQVLFCPECHITDNPNSPSRIRFKDDETLAAHVRKMHTRPFQCVFCWAGCESKFASKNEWKRHVMSQHILLHFWVCQEGDCAKIINVNIGVDERFAHGSIFNRKDLYTQHLRRMHQSAAVKKLHKQAKMQGKQPAGAAVTEFNDWVHDMQIKSQIERCRLPDHMVCPAEGCALDFNGPKAFDDRMEHVAKHLERAALGLESLVVFGGESDPTLTEWATRPEVGIAKRRGSNGWQQDNPLKPARGSDVME